MSPHAAVVSAKALGETRFRVAGYFKVVLLTGLTYTLAPAEALSRTLAILILPQPL
jgi:hypothetical protein